MKTATAIIIVALIVIIALVAMNVDHDHHHHDSDSDSDDETRVVMVPTDVGYRNRFDGLRRHFRRMTRRRFGWGGRVRVRPRHW